METCLADTGQSVLIMGGVAALLIASGVFMLLRYSKTRNGFIALVAAGTMAFSGLVSPVTHAASGSDECTTEETTASQPDVSTGMQGAVQTRNVLANDTPTPGSTFIPSSLRLALVLNPLPGSTLSTNKRTVVAPTEGTYDALATGVIRYDPDDNFVGTARGVRYLIKDTAGNTTTSTYTPKVTDGSVAPCTDAPAIDNKAFTISAGVSEYTTRIDAFTPDFVSMDMSADGSMMVGVSNFYSRAYISTDNGQTWRTAFNDTDIYISASMSDDGQKILFTTDDGSLKHSSNGGQNWTVTSAPQNSYAIGTISDDGTSYAIFQPDDVTFEQMYAYTSADATSWQQRYTATDAFIQGITMTSDGAGINLLTLDTADYQTSRIVQTIDGGATWNSQVLPSTNASDITASQDGEVLAYISAAGDVFISSDSGANWSQANSLVNQQWRALTMSGDGQKIFALSTDNDIYRSLDQGATWTGSSPSASPNWQDIAVSSDGNMVLANSSGFGGNNTSYISSNGGTTWSSFVLRRGVDTSTVDLNTSVAGIQRSYSYDQNGEAWNMVYDPDTDVLTLDVLSDSSTYYSSIEIPYSVTYGGGCKASAIITVAGNNS